LDIRGIKIVFHKLVKKIVGAVEPVLFNHLTFQPHFLVIASCKNDPKTRTECKAQALSAGCYRISPILVDIYGFGRMSGRMLSVLCGVEVEGKGIYFSSERSLLTTTRPIILCISGSGHGSSRMKNRQRDIVEPDLRKRQTLLMDIFLPNTFETEGLQMVLLRGLG
jgi:hypothetical protein